MVRFNNIKIVSLAMAASLPVLYLGFGAEAVRFSERQFAQYVGRCASDLGFYERHMRWCEGAYRVTYHKAPRHARAAAQETTYEPAPAGEQVHVYRNTQADTSVGKPDQFVALQTMEDVARPSSFFGLALGWFPGALNLGVNTLAPATVMARAPSRPRVVTTYYVKKVVASQ